MSSNPIVIIHGWSDHSSSFLPLANALQQRLQRPVQLINLADYISMDDEIIFQDLITAMMRAWRQQNLPLTPFSVDAVVHSTGGLIIRHWLINYFNENNLPIKHLVMLAPANFGSLLAHRGRAFIGRILKGIDSTKPFNVGAQLLKGLELASPYTWQLAMQDRFGSENFYDYHKILCTVLVGNTGYSGFAAAANEKGSDGTVRVSTANMNCALLKADFAEDPLNPKHEFFDSKGMTAFGVIDNVNHYTITLNSNNPTNAQVLNYIVQGLTVTDDTFADWCGDLNNLTQQTMQQAATNDYKHGMQNTVVLVRDQFNLKPEDYFMEFYAGHNGNWFTEMFYQQVIVNTHNYSEDNSYRSIYMDCTNFYQHYDKDWNQFLLRLTAYPELGLNNNVVGYQTVETANMNAIVIPKADVPRLLTENRTLLADIKIRREQAANVFKFSHL